MACNVQQIAALLAVQPLHGWAHQWLNTSIAAGQKKAREIWFLSRFYNAQEALAMGLVNTVVPLQELEPETLSWQVLCHCLQLADQLPARAPSMHALQPASPLCLHLIHSHAAGAARSSATAPRRCACSRQR